MMVVLVVVLASIEFQERPPAIGTIGTVGAVRAVRAVGRGVVLVRLQTIARKVMQLSGDLGTVIKGQTHVACEIFAMCDRPEKREQRKKEKH